MKKAASEVFTARDAQRILLCISAGVLMAVNLRTFVHAGGLFTGGISGLTVLIQDIFEKYLDIDISYGRLYLLLNLFPILLGFRKIGKKFTLYSFVVIGTVTFLTEVMPIYTITSDPLLISVFGGILNGAAVALALLAGATSGGTDFFAIYLSERFQVDGFNFVMGFNAVMLTTAGLLFGWEKALYSIIFQFASTQIIHFLNNRYKKNTLFIVTDHPDEVIACMYRDEHHGITEMKVFGTYKQKKERTMLYSVISTPELKKVLGDLKEVDPRAFINVIRTDQVPGRFYMKPND